MYPESKTEAGMVNDSKQKSLKSIFFNSVISGGISGSFVAVFAAPLELIKIQMQLASLIHKEQLSKIEKLKAEVAKKGLLDPKVYQARLAALNNLQAVNSRVEKMYFSKNGKMSNFASIKKIVQTRGVFGLYTGLGIHVGK
ncbi:hypothetical protein AX774_g577 [Zancudomyces culisetae]|uniref:Uncharacterized protein n=1 Tax=Zancudomyces culisetae TaxID=1213189 RepID=A0A1R1PY46_ZANCU|nr:hypothetical protein AX774_g577 [Zancudomyces culisetae]|eukprot:OMH85862.1 hypothetical protein AX774_g577 [Zancudomyces culisetae]